MIFHWGPDSEGTQLPAVWWLPEGGVTGHEGRQVNFGGLACGIFTYIFSLHQTYINVFEIQELALENCY